MFMFCMLVTHLVLMLCISADCGVGRDTNIPGSSFLIHVITRSHCVFDLQVMVIVFIVLEWIGPGLMLFLCNLLAVV